jgi:deazaflavin-dependent oxidoreductase (nitroreductase family)
MAMQFQQSTPNPAPTPGKPRVPSFVQLFNPIALRLMRLGVPMGPNALLSVRGRKSGLLRTTPVAKVEVGGRRWIVGTFGDVQWVRNLRASGEGILTVGRRKESMRAVELSREEAELFFAEVLGPYVRRLRLGRWLLGSVLHAAEILEDPHGAAERRPVFELTSLPPVERTAQGTPG